MNRFKFAALVVGLTIAFGASSAIAQTSNETGTASGSTVSVVTNGASVNIVSNIGGGSFGGGPPGGGAGGGFGGGGGGGFGAPPAGGGDQTGFNFDDSNGIQVSQTGASAGGVGGKLAVWVRGSYATFDQDQAQIASDGDTYTLGGGADWKFSDRFLAGLSLSYLTTDATLTFNNGTMDSDGYSVAPYFVALLGRNKNIALDGAVGIISTQNDVTRANGAVTGEFDSDSWFASSGVSYLINRGKFAFTPRLGVLWLDSTNDGYTESGAGGVAVPESDTQLGRLSFGGSIAYRASDRFTPFVSVIGEYDWETEDYSSFAAGNRPSVEDFGATVGLGASFALSERATGTLEGTTALGREDYSSYTLSGTLRFAF